MNSPAVTYEFTPQVLFNDALIALRQLVNGTSLRTTRSRWNTHDNRETINESVRKHPPYLPAVKYALENFKPGQARFPDAQDFACYRTPGDKDPAFDPKVRYPQPTPPQKKPKTKTAARPQTAPQPHDPSGEPAFDDPDRPLTDEELRELSLESITRLIRGTSVTFEQSVLDKDGHEVVLTTTRQLPLNFRAIKYLLSGQYDRDRKAIAQGRHLCPHCKGRRPCAKCAPKPPAVPFHEDYIPVLPWNAHLFADEDGKPIPVEQFRIEKPEPLLERYFRTYDRYDIPYTVEGAAEAIDIEPALLLDYPAATLLRPWHETFRRALCRIIRNMVERTLARKTSVRLTIFLLRHRFRFAQARAWLDPQNQNNLLQGLDHNMIRQFAPPENRNEKTEPLNDQPTGQTEKPIRHSDQRIDQTKETEPHNDQQTDQTEKPIRQDDRRTDRTPPLAPEPTPAQTPPTENPQTQNPTPTALPAIHSGLPR